MEETGEEGEEEGEYEEEFEEEVQSDKISILSVYDKDDFVSGAVVTLDSTIPENMLEFEYSYGYNCHKLFNLCACDDSVVCWSAGSIITFMDVNTKQMWFQRTSTGGSVGSITSYREDPYYRIAIAEGREGHHEPLIILYTWPQMEIDAVLRDGTANAYSSLDFSPDGVFLASVGKEPDYNLTIWNWQRHRILLRTSAFTFDVNTVIFSPYCPGQLTTGGAAHIKFWKMCETFTGLKLKGELGRFGKTEICDILGVYPMPDEKVLSGCEWGNVLVWEAGLVKFEVTQRGRKRCHQGPIVQFMRNKLGDEMTTIAKDGCIRAWYWDTVEQADPPEDDQFVEINPVAETCVPDCEIMCLKHQKDKYWYAQDGHGALWTVDLDIDKVQCDHKKIATFHAGPVIALVALRGYPILISAGTDGALQAYSTETNLLLARYHFPVAIKCVLYPPVDVDPTSRIIMLGFADGVMRMLFLHPDRLSSLTKLLDVQVISSLSLHSATSYCTGDVIDLISLLKPHAKAITQISINAQRTLLVTCGEDSTLFMYGLVPGTPFGLERLGYIETPNNIQFMTWKPEEERVILLCGQAGLIMEAVLPDAPVRDYKEITTFRLEFESWTEVLVKKKFMRYRPFPTEEDLASLDEEALKAKDKEEKDDEEDDTWIGEIQLMESTSMLGTTITWADYCEEGIWVIQKGTGALLLVTPGTSKILKYAPIPGAWCDDISAIKFICDKKYVMIGTNTGYIRVLRWPTEDEDNPNRHLDVWLTAMAKLMKKLKGRRLAKEETLPTPRIDFVDYYYLPMHDFYTGVITGLEFNSDGSRLYTCGEDGNIFSFKVHFPETVVEPEELPGDIKIPKFQKLKEPSSLEGELMCHEELKQKEEYDKMMAIANAHKKRVREQLAELMNEYNKLIKANRMLPCSQQIDVTLDPRPLVIQAKEIEEARALTHRKLAHQLEASDLGLKKMYNRNIIQLDVFPFILRAISDPEIVIKPLRQKNLSEDFYKQLAEVHEKMAEAALRGRRADVAKQRAVAKRTTQSNPRIASFLLGLPAKPPHPLKKALANYFNRLNRHHLQFLEWQEHLSRKPDPKALPPGAAEALKEAEETIGNKVLKTSPDYVASHAHNTQLRVCLTRKEIYDIKREFNEKVLDLRERKVKLVAKMKDIGDRLAEIRAEIPAKLAKPPPIIPNIDEELEFPEHNLVVKPEPVNVPKRGVGTTERSKSLNVPVVYPTPRVKAPRVPRMVTFDELKPLAFTWELLKHKPEVPESPIEVEIRERRITRHLYEQDVLLAEAEVEIRKFDTRLKQLQRERIRVQEKNQLLELHLYQLHREMNVLNRFEAHEDRLAERVYTKLMQVRGVQDQITECEHRIEDHRNEKENLGHKCDELQRMFKKLVQDNKFADFLRRIFKKKYRPPRDADDDESEEESESSSSEEDDVSLDSLDVGPIQLDPTICPEGCDQFLYDETYRMRNAKHAFEINMIEQDKFVELLYKDIEAHNKVKRKLMIQLDNRKRELKEFMMEKQNCLNEVTETVILRYDQIRARALQGCTGPGGLSQTVVFPVQVLHGLRRRLVEIQNEIKLQKARQKINKTHMHRMNVDIKFMEDQANDLRAQMRDVLTKKLGKPRKVDKVLDDLLKQMARRHKYIANTMSPGEMESKIREWKERIAEAEQKYFKKLEEHGEKLRLAAALQADILPRKPIKLVEIAGPYSVEQYQRDVTRLRIIRAQQNVHIAALQNEIQTLRTKPFHEVKEEEKDVSSYESLEEAEVKLPRVQIPHTRAQKYFPITPLGSQVRLSGSVNTFKMLFHCLDMMKISRDEAQMLLRDLNHEIPKVLTGELSRYEMVDSMLRKWLSKKGGDPGKYKKETGAFDALAQLANYIIQEHKNVIEGSSMKDHDVMGALEAALKKISDQNVPLQSRLGPALASLLHSAPMEALETPETMASLVTSLREGETPITMELIDKVNIAEVIADMRECGIGIPEPEVEYFIVMTLDSLRAQILTEEEEKQIAKEIADTVFKSRESSASLS